MRFLLIFLFLVSCQPALAQIEISSGFERKAGVPLDVDAVKADLTERDAIPNLIRYEGMIVYVVSEGVNFQLVGGIENENWVEVGSGGGDIVGPNSSTDNAIALFDGITGKLLKESALQIIDEPGESTLTAPDGESGTSITVKASNSTEDEPAGDLNLEAGTSVNSIYDGAIAFITGAATRLKILATGVIEVAQGSMLSFIDSSLNYVGIRGPTSASESYTLTLPADPPTKGKALIADETGQLEWGEAGGSGFGGKNYFVDPSYSESVDATRSYRELSFFNDGSGAFTDGGGLGYIVAFTGHGITQNQRVFYYHDGSPLDGSGNVIGVECYAQVLGEDIFGLSPVENGATEPLSDAGGVNSTHYFRIYEESLDHLSASVESASPLIEGGSLKLSFTDDGNSAVGEGIELLTNPIDREDMGKSLLFKVSADGTDDDYPEDDLIFKVVDKTNSKVVFIQGNQIKKTKKGYLIDTHLADSTKDLLVSMHVADDNASDDYDIIFGTFSIGPDSVVPGDSVVVEYAVNTSGITAAGASNTTDFLTGGPGSAAEQGVEIGNINSTTPTGNSNTAFRVEFSDDFEPGDLPILQVNRGDSNKWVSAESVWPRVNNGEARAGVILLPVSGNNRQFDVQFGNAGASPALATTYGAAGEPWSTVSTWRWRVKRTRVIKNTFSTTEIANRGTFIRVDAGIQSIANDTWTTLANFNPLPTEDSLHEWVGGGFKVKETGNYQIVFNHMWAASSAGFRAMRMTADGGTPFEDRYFPNLGNSIATNSNYVVDVKLTAGVTYAFQAYQASGASLDFSSGTLVVKRSVTDLIKFTEYGEGKVGDIKQSMLTETQFQSLHGSSWVLMDGRSVVGSRYAQITGNTTVPDARGMFLRGKNNGRSDGDQDPGGERTLGSYQADELKSHDHNMDGTSTPTSDGTQRIRVANGSSNVTLLSSPSGGTETRPRNIAVNFFIKIN